MHLAQVNVARLRAPLDSPNPESPIDAAAMAATITAAFASAQTKAIGSPYVMQTGSRTPLSTYRPAEPIDLAINVVEDQALVGRFARHGELFTGPVGILLLAAADWTQQDAARTRVADHLGAVRDDYAGDQRLWCEHLASWVRASA